METHLAKKTHVVSKWLTKTQFFILFWTLILGPFEYFVLEIPFVSMVLIRVVAIGSNLVWYKFWFERKFWDNYLIDGQTPKLSFKVRVSRMVSMKFLVNVTNFTILLAITIYVFDTGIHFTLIGFVKKVLFVTMFAVALTTPYEWLLKYFGFEIQGDMPEVDLASDI